MTRQPVIHVESIRKTYGRTIAVDDISFDVESEEIFGLIGPTAPARRRRWSASTACARLTGA